MYEQFKVEGNVLKDNFRHTLLPCLVEGYSRERRALSADRGSDVHQPFTILEECVLDRHGYLHIKT